MERVEYGEYIVADPGVCHGSLTFKGTRILVGIVLELVAEGKDWDWIVDGYRGRITSDAIAEAVQLATHARVSSAGLTYWRCTTHEQHTAQWS